MVPLPRAEYGAGGQTHAESDVDLAFLAAAAMDAVARFAPQEQLAAQERFEDLTYSAYARLNEERREILEQIRREGRVHGG